MYPLVVFGLVLAVSLALGMPAEPRPAQAQAGCTNLVADGGFEMGNAWQLGETPLMPYYEASVVHSGDAALALGVTEGQNLHSFSSARQTVTIPASADRVELTFWFDATATGAPTTDYMELVLLAPDGSAILDKPWFSRNDSRLWNQLMFDLTHWRGQTLQIYFNVYNDGLGGAMGMYLDGVSLIACPGGPGPAPTWPPDPQPSPTRGACPRPSLSCFVPLPVPGPAPSAEAWLPSFGLLNELTPWPVFTWTNPASPTLPPGDAPLNALTPWPTSPASDYALPTWPPDDAPLDALTPLPTGPATAATPPASPASDGAASAPQVTPAPGATGQQDALEFFTPAVTRLALQLTPLPTPTPQPTPTRTPLPVTPSLGLPKGAGGVIERWPQGWWIPLVVLGALFFVILIAARRRQA